MSQNQKKNDKNGKVNPLEAIRDISHATAQQMKSEASQIGTDFMDQLFGIKTGFDSVSGEIFAGETVEMSSVSSADREAEIKLQKQFAFERKLIEEEYERNERKLNDLKMELRAIQEELLMIVQGTQELAEETETAAMQSTVNPGLYHIIFFEKLLDFVRSFRKKVESANEWLASVNKRSSKKNMWGQNYAKHGASYLLSGEHYVARSAG
jgi:hypothetical protein